MKILDPTMDPSLALTMWMAMDPTRSGTVNVVEFHKMLSDLYGRDKSQKPSGVVQKVKAKILERSGALGGIKGLQR